MGCHALLQGILPTQGLNPHLLSWQAECLPLSHLERPIRQNSFPKSAQAPPIHFPHHLPSEPQLSLLFLQCPFAPCRTYTDCLEPLCWMNEKCSGGNTAGWSTVVPGQEEEAPPKLILSFSVTSLLGRRHGETVIPEQSGCVRGPSTQQHHPGGRSARPHPIGTARLGHRSAALKPINRIQSIRVFITVTFGITSRCFGPVND